MARTADPAGIVARELARCPPSKRATFLSELMTHSAAALTVLEGEREAAEAVYRLADAVVARGGD